MSKSPLVTYSRIVSNKTSPRNHKIDTITIHCVVGQCTLESLGNVFSGTRPVSSTYGISYDGKIGQYVDEGDRAWTSGGLDKYGNPIRVNGISGADNDHRAITIEVASDNFPPYAVTKEAYEALILLCADICKRNGIPKLLWKNDKTLVGKPELQNMTVHQWFANTACPGQYLLSRMGDIAERVNELLDSGHTTITSPNVATTEFTIDTNKKQLEIYRENGPVIGVTPKGIFTIVRVEVENGVKWGKLKSGEGWVNLTEYENHIYPKPPFRVRVNRVLRTKEGRAIPAGVFTIVETKDSFGKLKSGVGWIDLKNVKVVK